MRNIENEECVITGPSMIVYAISSDDEKERRDLDVRTKSSKYAYHQHTVPLRLVVCGNTKRILKVQKPGASKRYKVSSSLLGRALRVATRNDKKQALNLDKLNNLSEPPINQFPVSTP